VSVESRQLVTAAVVLGGVYMTGLRPCSCLARGGSEIHARCFGQLGQFSGSASVSFRVPAVGRLAASRQELGLVLVAVSPARAETGAGRRQERRAARPTGTP
jgi:hypothetical protein